MSTMTSNQPRLTTEIAELWPPQGQWTETEYFNLPDTNRIIELSEGEVFLMAPRMKRLRGLCWMKERIRCW